MAESDAIETARTLLARAGIKPSDAELARVAPFISTWHRAPKRATEPYIACAVEPWESTQ